MKLGVPQIIVLVIGILRMGFALAKHGEKKEEEKYSFFTTAIAFAINIAILNWGGFFK